MPHSQKKTRPDIKLAGDGIASRAMALALAKNGIASTIIAPQNNTPQAGGMQIAPNGWKALERLGLAQAAQPLATPLALLRVMALDEGFSIATIPLNTRKSTTPYTSIKRQDLSMLLEDACRKSQNLAQKVSWLNATITEVKTQDNKAIITLDDGKTVKADWLFGGDGLEGACRCYVAANEAAAAKTPLAFTRQAFRLTIDAKACPPALMGKACAIWLGDGCHIVHYPLAGLLNFVVVSHRATDATILKHIVKKHPQGSFLAGYLDVHASEISTQPLFKTNRLDAWQRGRVILTGAAAHPMPPHLAQGAGQALIDAAYMMTLLAQDYDSHGHDGQGHDGRGHDDDIGVVFSRWAGVRSRETRRLSRISERAGDLFALDGPLGRVRNFGLAGFGGLMGGGMLAKTLEDIWSS